MVMWVVDMVLKTDALSPNMTIQVALMILMGMLTRVMLLIFMVNGKSMLVYNRMVCNNWWIIVIELIHTLIRIFRMDMWLVELVY